MRGHTHIVSLRRFGGGVVTKTFGNRNTANATCTATNRVPECRRSEWRVLRFRRDELRTVERSAGFSFEKSIKKQNIAVQ